MATQQQVYESVIRLNTEQAMDEIKKLERETEQLVKEQKKWEEGSVKFKKYQKQIDSNNAKLELTRNRFKSIDAVLKSLSTAKPKELRDTIKRINELMARGDVKRGTKEWEDLTAALRKANGELKKIQRETRASESAWSSFIGFLNNNWGAITQILGSVTGLTMTMRKAVQDYASMEEEMANVRKYTGLTSEEVHGLNEELKKMDTRTSREELNQLAGAAGRLGITSQESIMEFVDAADKIKVALGDDLGEGAVDQIGKLAMAFGEDENMGLRKAMLATGSAINELAQNSSAKAGFLVDFTARVAGFGKQLGLTQAQIMGFGAVMDENLLRDEMAATAFGNMLTKMQTDTEKFARIAGMEVKEFTRLLNEDANQAILNLADSLRSQDPQTMMKMLDDMGLDGARAVGVLSTMADKIDDVRERQKLATDAYREGTSVINEFGVMNNTVQAHLDKCKKKFHEMTVELGEQLVPVVKYTCTGFSLMVRGLSEVMKFTAGHKAEIVAVSVAIAAYTAYVKAATIATKIHTVATNAAKLATEAFNFVTKMNPIGLVIAALTAAVVLFIKYRDRIAGASEATSMLRQTGAKLAGVLGKVTGWMIDLVKWAVSLYDKFSFLRKIVQLLVTAFTTGFTTITIAVKLLIDEFDGLATIIEGCFTLDWDKIKEGYKKGFKAVADAAVAQWNNVKRTVSETFSAPPPAGSGENAVAEGAAIGASIGKAAADVPVEQTVPEIVVKPQKKIAPYVSDADRKKQEQEQRKAEADRKKREAEELKAVREQNKQLKAETDQRLAEEAVSYSLGLTDYLSYIEKRKEIQLEGIRQRKALFEKGSAEYLKLDAQEKQLLAHGDEEQRKLTLKEYEQMHRDLLLELEKDFNTEGSAIYQNEAAYREQRFREEMDFLENRKSLTRKGSLERMQIEWEIEDRSKAHQLETQRYYEEQVEQLRENYLNMGNERLRDIALKGLDDLYRQGLIKEEEYQKARIAIQAQYASAVSPDEQTAQTGSQMLTNARNKVNENAQKEDKSYSAPIVGTIQQYQATMEQLKELYANDEENHAAYLAAKQQATAEFCQQMASQFQAAYNSVNQIMSAASSLYSAQADYETAIVKKKYEKQIAAAGNNQKKVKKLQEKQQKEEAAIKTKYNRKQVKIQIAQAIAQTAMNALNAYGSVVGIPIVGPALAVVAAAAAVAAGMIQIAAIKKQAEAQEAGYYEGGYTGGKKYRKEAGVVHEGEFVANHQAVNNPNVRPMLDFIDKAQRNNTVGSLTAGDISRQLGQGGTAVVAPVVNVNNDNEDLRDSLDRSSEVSEELLTVIREKGIHVDFPMDSFHREYNHFKKLNNR